MSVDVSQVHSFEISGLCAERFPCGHAIKLRLLDGREITRGLNNPEIYDLISALAADKIIYPGGKEEALKHFAVYKGETTRSMGHIARSLDTLFADLFGKKA